MPITPDSFLEHCEDIRENYSLEEIVRRDIVSRGYYYTYHYVRTRWGGNPNYPSTSEGRHIAAQEYFRHIGEKQLADDLDDLHTQRKLADYNLENSITSLDRKLFERERDQFIQVLEESLINT